MPAKYTPKQRVDAFWSKVKLPDLIGTDECREWQASCNQGGYGSFGIGNYTTRPAHRIAYQIANGAIPDGLDVLHCCDNPPCCNPDHLRLGTDLDNVRDMISKGRRSSTAGVNNPRVKLTPDQVVQVRNSVESARSLALRLGVCDNTILNIRSRRTWRHIE